MNLFRRFAALQSASGLLLLAGAAAALLWANSPWGPGYEAFWQRRFGNLAGHGMNLLHAINDGLMAIFFLLVGLEIKRELIAGELAEPRKALLPILAALGGMLVPAALYAACNLGGPHARGWGIPMATDIAFALGALSVLGSRVPVGLKVFLTALAIIDDIGAVLVIAFFYTSELSGVAFGAAGALVLLLSTLARRGVASLLPYLGLGVLLWIAFLRSGVHASIAGVVLAFLIPHPAAAAGGGTPLQRLEKRLHPWVGFLILPLFALANAGIVVDGSLWRGLGEPLGFGVMLGLLVGKPVGIVLFAFLAVRLRWAALPAGASWLQVLGVGILGGIGFTMSIFIAGLAFPEGRPLALAKLAILTASAASGLLGILLLRAVPKTYLHT